MTTIQSNKERMGDTLSNIFRLNSAIYQGNAKFVDYVNLHETNLANVRKWKNAQEEAMEIIGINRDKEALRFLMAAEATVIIGGIINYADSVNNNELKASVNYSESEIKTAKETKFTTIISQVIRVALLNAEAIADFSITPEMRQNLELDLVAYQRIMTKGKTKQVEITTFTKNLAKSLSEMMYNINTSLVQAIKFYRRSDPDFVAAFTKGKIIPKISGTATGVHGRVINAETTQRLKGIVVEIVELAMLTSTDATGMYRFLRVPMGNYTLRLRGNGYTPIELPLRLEDGKLIVVDIKMEALPELVPA